MSQEALREPTGAAASSPTWWVDWLALVFIILFHVLAVLALTPWFFSWTGVVVMLVGMYTIGMLGINVGYHRLLAHRSFTCPRWFERTLAIIGIFSLQDSPAYWVAVHRRHHQFADEDQDPHSPLVNFAWAYVGWIVIRKQSIERRSLTERYARDLIRDPFYVWIENYWTLVTLGQWVVYFAGGFIGGVLMGMATGAALWFATGIFLWGVVVRTVVMWHLTWALNSVAHRWGYRNYQTPDDSRNNVLLGFATGGEGCHNNHHAYPSSARHGHRWWEFDYVYGLIRLLAAVGLAKNVKLPGPLRD